MRFLCPHCNRTFDIQHPPAGEQVACPHCAGALALPAVLSEPAASGAARSNDPAGQSGGVDLGFDPRAVAGATGPAKAKPPRDEPPTVDARGAAPAVTPPQPTRRVPTREERLERQRRKQVRSALVMVVCLVLLLVSAVLMSRW